MSKAFYCLYGLGLYNTQIKIISLIGNLEVVESYCELSGYTVPLKEWKQNKHETTSGKQNKSRITLSIVVTIFINGLQQSKEEKKIDTRHDLDSTRT